MYCAIDPGLSTGYAILRPNGTLFRCGAMSSFLSGFSSLGIVIRKYIIELPQVYNSRQSKGDPNDLIKLAVRVGRYCQALGIEDSQQVLPHEWKGSIKKEIHHPRIWEALSDTERDVVSQCGKGLAKRPLGDMMDAVGLSKYAFANGRFQ